MSDFQYTATDVSGKMVRNILPAIDKNDLIAQLQQQGLFLVSCMVIEENLLDKAVSPPPPPAAEISALRRDDSSSMLAMTQITWKHQALMAGMLLGGIVIGLWRWQVRQIPLVLDTVALNQTLVLLQSAKTRQDVEQALGPGSHSPLKYGRRYFIKPYWVIDIPYENNGKFEDPQDRPLIKNSRISRTTSTSGR